MSVQTDFEMPVSNINYQPGTGWVAMEPSTSGHAVGLQLYFCVGWCGGTGAGVGVVDNAEKVDSYRSVQPIESGLNTLRVFQNECWPR